MTEPVAGASRPTGWWLRVLFGVIGLAALILGYVGFERLNEVRPDTAHDPYDVFYFVLQLFVIGAEPFQNAGPYPWQLQVARFAAPLFTLLAVAEAGRLLLASEIRRLRARRARGHVLVCGDSQFAHMLADRLFADGERVVVVRSKPFGPLEYRWRRYLGVIGDPTSPEVLRGAGLPRAHTIYACSEDDDRNHAIANTASRLIHDRRQPPRVYVLVHDSEMCLSLQARRLGAAGSSRLRLDYFHVDDVAARALHRHHPLPRCGRPTNQDPHRRRGRLPPSPPGGDRSAVACAPRRRPAGPSTAPAGGPRGPGRRHRTRPRGVALPVPGRRLPADGVRPGPRRSRRARASSATTATTASTSAHRTRPAVCSSCWTPPPSGRAPRGPSSCRSTDRRRSPRPFTATPGTTCSTRCTASSASTRC